MGHWLEVWIRRINQPDASVVLAASFSCLAETLVGCTSSSGTELTIQSQMFQVIDAVDVCKSLKGDWQSVSW